MKRVHVLLIAAALGGCSQNSVGTTGTGGSTTGTGGSPTGTGGAGTGGLNGTGGVTGTGGATATGGASGTGGATATGGASGTGGAKATGGAGGAPGTGGAKATGGTGGAAGKAGGTGGAATGGNGGRHRRRGGRRRHHDALRELLHRRRHHRPGDATRRHARQSPHPDEGARVQLRPAAHLRRSQGRRRLRQDQRLRRHHPHRRVRQAGQGRPGWACCSISTTATTGPIPASSASRSPGRAHHDRRDGDRGSRLHQGRHHRAGRGRRAPRHGADRKRGDAWHPDSPLRRRRAPPGRNRRLQRGQRRALSLLLDRRGRAARGRPGRRRLDQPRHAAQRGAPRGSRRSTPASRSRSTSTAATTSPSSRNYIKNAMAKGVPFDVFAESCYAGTQGQPADWHDDVHRAVHLVPELEVHDRRVQRRAAAGQRHHLQSPQQQGIGTFNWQPGDLWTRSGANYTAQTDMVLYDLMKTAYAARL